MMSTAAPLATEPCAAARAGADLKAARDRLGWPLESVAHRLRIRLPHLEALERGDISSLPGNAYALAFVRTYAGALGLDSEEMVRRFRTEASGFGREPQLRFPVPMPERGLPAGAVMLLGLILLVGAYAGWYRLSGEGRLPAETVTAVPERLAPLAEQAIAPPTPPQGEASPAAAPQIVLTGPGTPDTSAYPAPPVMAISPTSAAAAQLPPHLTDNVPSGDAPDSGMAPLLAVPAPETSRITLRAAADTWLQVKDRAGAVLLNRVLKTGETWDVPPRNDLLLTTGNAGGTEILVDGAATAALGGNGAVRRDLTLDPDQIKDGKLAIAAAAPAAPRPRQ